jgi:hypothetical protein
MSVCITASCYPLLVAVHRRAVSGSQLYPYSPKSGASCLSSERLRGRFDEALVRREWRGRSTIAIVATESRDM